MGLRTCCLMMSPCWMSHNAGTWWAAWRCSWLKITWSSTWTELLLGVRCLGSAGSRNATKWLTEGEKGRNCGHIDCYAMYKQLFCIIYFVLSLTFFNILCLTVMADWGRTWSLWSSLIPHGSYALSWPFPGPLSGKIQKWITKEFLVRKCGPLGEVMKIRPCF